jgi:hypothetical protein
MSDTILTYDHLKDKLELSDSPKESDLRKIIDTLIAKEDGGYYIYRYGKEFFYDEQVELKKLKFEDILIEGLNLSSFDFSFSGFKKVHFKDCNLIFSKFNNTQLVDCTFSGCNMNQSEIIYMDAKNCVFSTIKFYSAYMKWMGLANCKFINVEFKNGLLTSTNFSTCIFDNVRFLGGMELSALTFPLDFDRSLDFRIKDSNG